MTLRQHGLQNRTRPPATSDMAALPPVPAQHWSREYDEKAHCPYCRNQRSTRHVEAHAKLIASGTRYWPAIVKSGAVRP